jgi:putative Holliday junction resolvase
MMSRVLAIDYGLKRCGLAVTDPLRIIASPLAAVTTSELKDFLKRYITSENVRECVIGIPFTANDHDTSFIVEIRSFVEWMRKEFPLLKISEFDEFGTSAEASRALLSAGVPKKKRQQKSNIDVMSAVIILKKHLEEYI